MQPSIFGKNLDDITYTDVITFCEQGLKEGLGLDYKRDLSNITSIVKTLASFANSNGGWIIVGVDDANDAPKLPAIGMDFETNYEQRINNSIISSVHPIVLPIYKVCVNDDSSKAFVIIYMPQSPAAPHWMNYKGKNTLFIRLADRAKNDDWEDYASSTQWELMRNRRQASVDLRRDQINNFFDIFDAKAEQELRKHGTNLAISSTGSRSNTRHAIFTQIVEIKPEFPTAPVATVPTIMNTLQHETFTTGYNYRRPQTPDLRGYDVEAFQQGGYLFHEEPKESRYFFGLDIYGNVINIDRIDHRRGHNDGDTEEFIEITDIIDQIAGMLGFVQGFYVKSGLVGNLLFEVSYVGINNTHLFFTHANNRVKYSHTHLPSNMTGAYRVAKRLDTAMLTNNEAIALFIRDVIEEIMYSFNFPNYNRDEVDILIRTALSLSSKSSADTIN
jgi:hypothetical protein